MLIKYLSDNTIYKLNRPPLFKNNTVEVHYDGYTKENINGFVLITGIFEEDYSNYTTKWNVLTDLPDGVVYSCDESVETEDDRLIVPTEKQKKEWEEEAERQEREQKSEVSLQDRITDLESALCELYEMLGE